MGRELVAGMCAFAQTRAEDGPNSLGAHIPAPNPRLKMPR
jgi:hypothetical protein